ncbi:MAG: glyoxylase-like metal-dependent hydrolase (beta-lactamase superfamily II) [Porticoccus sp.]|jgi:glyoxylase-like metal-dependent hydrolase (beta-lactamase superfamily II)
MTLSNLLRPSGLSLAILLTTLLTVNASSAQHEDSPKFSITPVTDNLSMLQGRGGNLALLTGDQGLLLVDNDYQDMSAALETALAGYGGADKLTYIINTHWHGDHTGGNLALGQYANIVAHDNVRKRLLSAQEIKLFKMKSDPYPEIAVPSITYEKAMSLHINGEEVELVHFAGGHTDGDSIVFFKSANVVHTGDHFFNGFFPFVDVDSGGNVLVLAENVKLLLGMIDDNTKIIPGHGPLANKADLMAFSLMLEGTAAEIKAMKDKGLSLAKIQQQGLSDNWQSWTDGFLTTDVWVSIVYNSL